LIGDCKDHQRLERLKAEEQDKINEFKKKINNYITQQLIHVRIQGHGFFLLYTNGEDFSAMALSCNWFEFS
jgi:hypothetical protein